MPLPFSCFDAVIAKHIVKYENQEVHYLNELEFVNGEVWANVWQVYSNLHLVWIL